MQQTRMSRWNRSRKAILWMVGILSAIVILVFVAGSLLQRKLPDSLKNTVSEKSKGLYRLNFADMQVNILRGKVSVKNVQLSPDMGRYRQLGAELKANKLYDLAVGELQVTGFRWLKFLLTKQIEVRDIKIDKPSLRLQIMEKSKERSTASKGNLWEQLPQQLHDGKIGTLSVLDLTFSTQDSRDSLQSNGQLENLNLYMEDIRLDKTAWEDTARCWFAKDIRVYGKNVRYSIEAGLYRFQVKELEVSTKQRKFNADSLCVIPKYTEKAWSTSLKYKQDRYDMTYPKIATRGINFKELQLHNRLPIDFITINNARVNIYADKGMAEKRTMASNNFPSLAFQRLGLPVTVNGIRIRNTDVYYKELNPKSGKAGLVFFKALEGRLSNVSNDAAVIKRSPLIKCHFTTFFLGKPKLTVDLNFNMADKNGAFNYAGALTAAPASFYNQLLEPITLARAEEGMIHAVRFQVKANRYGADVVTEMYYNNLKVAVLDATSGKLEKKGFLSLFVNWLAVKTNNPSKENEPARIAQHYYKHPPEKTFFSLMWKAVYSGLKVNLGLPNI